MIGWRPVWRRGARASRQYGKNRASVSLRDSVHGDAFGSEFVKDRKVTDLLTAFANDPRLGDEFHPRDNRVLVNNFKKSGELAYPDSPRASEAARSKPNLRTTFSKQTNVSLNSHGHGLACSRERDSAKPRAKVLRIYSEMTFNLHGSRCSCSPGKTRQIKFTSI
jgi:hypothetical protein